MSEIEKKIRDIKDYSPKIICHKKNRRPYKVKNYLIMQTGAEL